MKHLTLIILLGLLLTFQFLPAQAPDTLWTKTYGGVNWDAGEAVQQTADGGYIIVGSSQSYGTGGNTDIWLIKTNSSGDTLWTNTIGGLPIEYGKDVMQTSDNGFIISGYSVFGPDDLILIKTDSLGDTLWTRNYGGTGEAGYSVQQTLDGGYIVGGYTGAAGPGERDFWLVRTDGTGDTLWAKSFGGSGWDFAYSARQTSDLGYIIVGYTESYGAGEKDYWLIKTDSSGDMLWTKTYGGSGTDYGRDVQQTLDGGYIILGYSNSFGTGGDDIWLVKTDASGDTLWTRTIGGPLADFGFSIQETYDGGYIITGATDNNSAGRKDILMIKTNSSGEPVWINNFGGIDDDIGLSVQQTVDGGYIMAGRTESFGHGSVDVWLIRLAPDTASTVINNDIYLAKNFNLNQNYPNPFNPITTIEFELTRSSEVTLKIYNIVGEEVATLLSASLLSGSHSVQWDASNLASGVYLYKLEAGDYIETRKMIIMK